MAFIVIHLWGKFWMAAWRGRRALTWMSGVVAFAVSIVECFTGYLSQQNFDSQWISTNGKDAINAAGLGGLFDLMNFGQMLLWLVVLIPIALVLVVGLAVFLSSPDVPPVTVATWAKIAPADFLATAASELAGTSETATYGPPYNNGSAYVQGIGPSWQRLAGVMQPINAARTFVLDPLGKLASTDHPLAKAISDYERAPAKQRATWDSAYLTAVTKVSFVNGAPVTPRANDGPVPMLASTELTLARAGATDADLVAQHPFYGTDYTKPLLFLEDGSYFSEVAQKQHLTGSQCGVISETGSYPGQPWLWLYTLWYHSCRDGGTRRMSI